MRQGPDYTQYVETDEKGRLVITVPLELAEDFEGSSAVVFHVDKDGTITLKVFDLA